MALLTKRLLNYLLPVTILGLSIGGALTQNIPSLLAMVLVICITVGLVGFGKLDKKVYPVLLGAIGLSLLYQTTLYSPYMIGTDIHTEYYYFKLAYNGWDSSIPHNYNSALGITVLAPFLSKLLHIDGTWVFKIIYPFLFSLVPAILYCAFKKLLDERNAFLSSFFFISMPVWALEAVSISKLQLSGVFFSLLVLLTVSNLSGKRKAILAILGGVGIAATYYTIGFLLMLYLAIGIIFLAVIKVLPWVRPAKRLPLEGLMVTSMAIVVLALAYFGIVGGGEPIKTFAYYSYSGMIGVNPVILSPTSVNPEVYTTSPTFTSQVDVPTKATMLRAVVGLDFFEASLPGKLFRVFQLMTEVLILLGIIYLVKTHKRVPEGYLLFVGVALFILLLMIVKPGFSSLINMTRLYHTALYLLAPLLVMGGILLFRKKVGPIIACGVLIPYFLFTSGFVFEVAKVPNIERLDLPYSIALSSYRIDISGIYEKEDEQAANWLIANWDNKIPVYADLPGMEYLYEFPEIGPSRAFLFPQDWLPEGFGGIPKNSYIFLRKWNTDSQKITYWVNIGLRKSYTYEEIGINELLEGRPLLYDKGAQIYGPK